MSDYVLSAVLRLKDQMTSGVQRAGKSLNSLKAGASSASSSLGKMEGAASSAGAQAGKLAGQANQAASSLKKLRGSYRARIVAQDEVSGKVGSLRAKLSGLVSKPYTATIRTRMEAGAAKLKAGLSSLATGMGGMAAGLPLPVLGAAGVGAGILSTVKAYADFEKQMSAVGAISQASAADMELLSNKAKEMGMTTSFSATEAGKAFEYMAMAGWKTPEMLQGVKGVMDLAAASGEELGRVSDIVTDALTAFGLKASDSGHFADVLAQAATNSNTNVSMMGETFKYVAPLAGTLKYKIEDVGVAIGLMANAGIKGEQAGTSLRSIMMRLAAPPKEAAKAMQALGLSVKNSDGTIKPWMQTMTDLRTAFSKLSDVEKVDFAKKIAGTYALSGFEALINAPEEDFQKLTQAMNTADGAAARMAERRLDNLAGDVTLLKSSWESLQLAIMDGKGGEGIRDFVQGVKKDIDRFKGYLEDGFDISDVGKLALNILDQLKQKFLAFDGIGSVLAGGVLAGGLYKIVRLLQKAKAGVRGLSATGKAGAAAGQAVGQMTVTAGTVIVNGKVAGAAAAAEGRGAAAAGGKGGGSWRSRISASRSAIAGGAAFSAFFGVLDLWAARQHNAETSADAAILIKQATNNLQAVQQAYGVQSQEYHNAFLKAQEAKQFEARTNADNAERMGAAVGSSAGGVLGTVLGGVIGSAFGPVGTMIGMTAGGLLGEIAGEKIGSYLSRKNPMEGYNYDNKNDTIFYSNQMLTGTGYHMSGDGSLRQDADFSDIYFGGNGGYNPRQSLPDGSLGSPDLYMSYQQFGGADAFSAVKQSADEASAHVQQTFDETNAHLEEGWSNTADYVIGTADGATSGVEAAAEEASTSVEESASSIDDTAEEAAAGVEEAANEGASGTEAAYAPIPTFMDGAVFVPMEQGSSRTGSSISTNFQTSAVNTQGAWSGVGAFFQGLFADIAAGAARAAASVAASMASAAASVRAAGHPTIAAGLDWVGNNAAWLAGTPYPQKAAGTSFAEGGWTEVNEHGGEIIDLPQGARVYPHATTMKMLNDVLQTAPTQTASQSSHVSIAGNTFVVREEADIDKIAHQLVQLISLAQNNYNYVGV